MLNELLLLCLQLSRLRSTEVPRLDSALEERSKGVSKLQAEVAKVCVERVHS